MNDTLSPSRWKTNRNRTKLFQRIESARAQHTLRINALRRKLRSANPAELATQFAIWQELRSHPDNASTEGPVSPEEHRSMIEFLFRDEFARRGIKPL